MSNNQQSLKKSVEDQFSQAAENYRTSPIHALGPDLAAMLKFAQLTGDEAVLDAGSGAGHTALYLAPHVATVTAYDLSESMLTQVAELAQERDVKNVQVRQGDVEDLPFESCTFDRVTTRYSAHHWPNPPAALKEIRRVLRPTGILLFGDIISFEDPTIDTHFQTIELLRDKSHVRDHTLTEWQSMLNAAGFENEVVERWEVYIDFASWVERMATPAPAQSMIRTILAEAPHEVQQALKTQPDGSFTMQAAILRATPRS